jgi:hypothetical protein
MLIKKFGVYWTPNKQYPINPKTKYITADDTVPIEVAAFALLSFEFFKPQL